MTTMTGLVRGETTRLLGYRSLWVLPAAAVPMTAMSVFGAAAVEAEKLEAATTTAADSTIFLIGMAFATTLFSSIGGVIQVTRDLKARSFGLTALVEPSRHRIIAAKAFVASAVGVLYAVIGLLTCVVAGYFAAAHNGFAFDVPTGRLTGLALGMVAINVFSAAWGVALGTIIRHQAGAIGLVVIWTTMVDTALIAFFPKVGRVLPGGAVAAVLDDPELPERFSAGVGLGALALWLAAALTVAQKLVVHRAI